MNIIKAFLIIATLSIFTNHALANTQQCSLIKENDERRNCHAKAPHEKPEDWTVLKSNYFESITVSRPSSYLVQCDDTNKAMTMVFVCAKKSTSLYLSGFCLFGETDETRDVLFQVDDQEPQSTILKVPKNRYTLILKDGSATQQLINTMLEGEQLHLRITPKSNVPFTATYDVSDLEGPTEDFRAACEF